MDHDDREVESVRIREHANQFVLEAEPLPPPQVVGHRRAERQEPQLTRRPDRLPVPDFRRFIGDGVVLRQEIVESGLEFRVSAPYRPGDALRLGKLRELSDFGTRADDDPSGGFIHDRGVESALLDPRPEAEGIEDAGHRHSRSVRVMDYQALFVGRAGGYAEHSLGPADDPFPGNRERHGERHPFFASLGDRQGGDRDIGAAFLQRHQQSVHVGRHGPFGAQAVALGESVGEEPVALLGQSLGGEGLVRRESVAHEADHAPVPDRGPVVGGPRRHRGDVVFRGGRTAPPERDQEGQHRGSADRESATGVHHRRHTCGPGVARPEGFEPPTYRFVACCSLH